MAAHLLPPLPPPQSAPPPRPAPAIAPRPTMREREGPYRLELLKAKDAAPADWKPPWEEAPASEGKLIAFSLMRPTGLAKRILGAAQYESLMRFALKGCRADCGEPWSAETIQAALDRGVNPSAREPEAIEVLWEDLTYQQEAGFVRIVPSRELLGASRPVELKISPVAVIPQVGRRPRIILNLSAQVKTPGTRRCAPSVQPSVNETTKPADDQEAVQALGTALRSLILMTYEVDCAWSIYWQKVDLSDGFWRMVVDAGMEYNFVFQLPRRPGDEEDHFVVPGALQMGWKNSPAYFCTATETTLELVRRLLALTANTALMDRHRHETFDGRAPGSGSRPATMATALILLRVFVDDFLGAVGLPPGCTMADEVLRWVTRGTMHGIHAVFPPTDVTGHTGGKDSISEKKLKKGDATWETGKTMLGLYIQGAPGADRTVGLPPEKTELYVESLESALSKKKMMLRDFLKIAGRVRWASTAIPSIRGFMAPCNRAAAGKGPKHFVGLGKDREVREALATFRSLLCMAKESPSHISEIVGPSLPHIYGMVDASAQGMGGVILPCTLWIQPTVWRLEMTPALRRQVERGELTIADCEAVAWFLQECIIDELLVASCTGTAGIASFTWSDNSPTVGWAARRASNAQSPTPNRLLRWISLRQRFYRRGPQDVGHWEGITNIMADFCSRSFTKGCPTELGEDHFFGTFANMFPLPCPQLGSWRLYRPSAELTSAAFSLLRQTKDTRTLPTTALGDFGVPLPEVLAKTLTLPKPSSPASTWNESTCSWPLLLPSGAASPTMDGLLRGRESRKYFEPADRPWSPKDFATLGSAIRETAY